MLMILALLALLQQSVHHAPSLGALAGPGPSGLEAPPEAPPAQPSSSGCGSSVDVPNVYLHSGEFFASTVDLRIPGRGLDFVWARKYRSRNGPNQAQGNGWD